MSCGKATARRTERCKSRILARKFQLITAQLSAIGNTLYFRAKDGAGFELWKSDGTESGHPKGEGHSVRWLLPIRSP